MKLNSTIFVSACFLVMSFSFAVAGGVIDLRKGGLPPLPASLSSLESGGASRSWEKIHRADGLVETARTTISAAKESNCKSLLRLEKLRNDAPNRYYRRGSSAHQKYIRLLNVLEDCLSR